MFATIGKSGGFFQEQSEAICRLISLSLRSGIKVEEIIDDLKGIRGPMAVLTAKGTVLSLPDAIGQVLEEHVKENGPGTQGSLEEANISAVVSSLEPKREKAIADYGFMPGCPDCGSRLVMAEGCISCKNCGYTRCL